MCEQFSFVSYFNIKFITITYKSMRKITYLISRVNSLALVLFFTFLSINVFAEGTPTVSPNAANITALISAPDFNSGSFYNCAEDNRVKFTITDNVNENLYFGFDWRQYVVVAPPRLTNVYWRIRRSSDLVVVAGPTLWNSTLGTAGSIDTHAQALAGPNIAGSVPAGYLPIVFDPVTNGEFFIEFFRSNNLGVTPLITNADRAVGALFDFTVARNSAPYTKFNGRLNSDKWGFVAVSATYGNLITANAEPVLYAYTTDQAIIKLDFEVGFEPIAFDIAVNKYGVVNSGSWATSRRSVNNAITPSLNNGYQVFLNIPDATLFPVGSIPSSPTFLTPSITGCGPYFINYNVSEAGDVKLFLNLNGVAGFQSASADRIIEAFDVIAGNNSLSWDGLNGLGVPVASGTNVALALTFLKGRFNLPLHDAELNKNGLRISIIAPTPIANAQVFWDDSIVTDVGTDCSVTTNNQSGIGINNSFAGTISPAHAWSGNGNSAQTIPAPANGANETDGIACTDFGNARTINTWGWGATTAATNLNIVLGCTDIRVVKTVNNSSPTFGSNVIFTIVASNISTSNATGVVVTDLLPSGYTYVSDTSGGTYNSGTGVWAIGNIANGANSTLNITATVLTSGVYSNSATATSNEIDTNSFNNSSTVIPIPSCNASVSPALIKN